ncbi:MAG: PilC/PilY family type IV pilus protein [Desulfobacterales bacterium]|jgi:type IV pilus assembly protein PilY1
MQNQLKNTIYCLLVIFMGLAICPAVFAETPDYPDECSTTDYYDVALNSSTDGYIEPKDKDVFRIYVPSAGTLTIYSTSTLPMDPKGKLMKSGCKKIAEHNDIDKDASPPNYNFQIVKDVPSGEYWIEVKHDSDKGQGDYTLYVDFDAVTAHTITAANGAGGNISPIGSVSVPHNGSQAFTITPDACYSVQDVLVDGVSVGAVTSYVFNNVTSDRTISVHFAAFAAYTITANAGPNGSIGPAGAVSVGCGADQSFSITPDTGYEVLDVQIDGVSYGPIPSYTFSSVTQDHSISATFKVIGGFVIHTYSGFNGSISPPGPVSVPPGGSQSFAIAPQPGYQVAEVWVDGVSQGTISAYTFNAVDADHTIEAQFTPAGPPPDPSTCIDISDTPLDARFRSAPANIMFVLDDSGSMDWEIMTDESDGLFMGHRYIFDNPGDNLYSDSYILSGDERKKWKSQWSGYNKMYYNPQTVYEPWPNKDPADISNPRSHPHHATPTLDLSATYDSYSFSSSEVIADNMDSSAFSASGPWDIYIHPEAYPDFPEPDYDLYHAAVQADTSFSVEWITSLPGGNYDVYARWHANDWRSTMVPYKIHDVQGGTMVYVNQQINGGQWVLLGDFYFGTDQAKVTIEAYVEDPNADRVCADAIKFVPRGEISFDIPNAHYYVWSPSQNKPYLVVVDGGAIDYYMLTDFDGDDAVDSGELMPVSVAPADIASGRTYAEERQNFANWYSFYRRRELTATAAVAGVIAEAGGVQIGIYGINEKIVQPVHKIHVEGVDETDTLLNHLYSLTLTAMGTPLRRGVQNVGKYFDKTDSDTGGIGNSPYASADDGGECQQSFAIVMTDGYYNGSTEPWDPAENVDGDNGAPYTDTYSNTLADVAMYYYENDLADLADEVPTNERDDATHQHMVTYTIGFGVTGTLDPLAYDFENSIYPTWPDPDDGNKQKIDDLWHASVNGRGRYLTANNAVELINDMLLILKDIEIFSGSASSVSVNGDELYMKINNDVLLFQSKYYSEGWHGDVLAYHVDPVSGELIEPPIWSAAHSLSYQTADNRKIATYDGISAGTPFRYNQLTDHQRDQLDINWQSDATLAQNMVDYLRGDGANEVDNGGTFRNRTWTIVDPGHPYNGDTITSSKLGDIVHSSPVYSNGALFSGGNDGMLHAFDADTGEELFAYVPNLLYPTLNELVDPNYTHKYYVDLTPTVENVDIGGVTRMLVGGFGKGSIGYYALNLSDLSPADGQVPANEDQVADMVMWEYPNLNTPVTEIADLGYSFSRATIVQTNDSTYPWVVIFGNGYNSPNGRAVLFIVNPLTGELIKRLDTQVGGCNGLSTPIATDVDYDNKVDFVYAGDLNGHMWKFDLSGSDYHDWEVSYQDAGTPKPMFKTAANQPITTRPDVMFHCAKPGYTVVFGTGRYLGDVDLADTSQQAIYGIWDYGEAEDYSEYVGTFNGGSLLDTPLSSPPVSVLPQTVVNQQMFNGFNMRTVSDNAADWTVTSLDGAGILCGDWGGMSSCDPNGIGTEADPIRSVGWYLNLDGTGERVVSDVLVRDGTLIAISYIPSGNMCGTGGKSWLWALDACAGARLNESVFDVNDDGVIDGQDMVNIGTPTDPVWVPPTCIRFDGRLQPPAIIILDDKREMLYMSSSKGEIELQLKKAAKLGMTFWRVYRP